MSLVIARSPEDVDRAVEAALQLQLHLEELVSPVVERGIRQVLQLAADIVENSDGANLSLALVSIDPIIRSVLARVYGKVFAVVNSTHDLFVKSPETEQLLLEYLRGPGGKKIQQVSESLRQEIMRVVQEKAAEGVSMRSIAAALRQQVELPGIGRLDPRTRAMFISRTEVHSAAQFARWTYLNRTISQSLRERLIKVWVAVLDSRVRMVHAQANGQEVPFLQPFTVGGEQLMFPGDPIGSAWNVINCRCQFVISPKRLPRPPRIADVASVSRPTRTPRPRPKPQDKVDVTLAPKAPAPVDDAERAKKELLEKYPPPPKLPPLKFIPYDDLVEYQKKLATWMRDTLGMDAYVEPRKSQHFKLVPYKITTQSAKRLQVIAEVLWELKVTYPKFDLSGIKVPIGQVFNIPSSELYAGVSSANPKDIWLGFGSPFLQKFPPDSLLGRSFIRAQGRDSRPFPTVNARIGYYLAKRDASIETFEKKLTAEVLMHELLHTYDARLKWQHSRPFKHDVKPDEITEYTSKYATAKQVEFLAEFGGAFVMREYRELIMKHQRFRELFERYVAPVFGEPNPVAKLLGLSLFE